MCFSVQGHSPDPSPPPAFTVLLISLVEDDECSSLPLYCLGTYAVQVIQVCRWLLLNEADRE